MVRYIERAQAFLPSSELYHRPNSHPSGPCSSVVELYWGKMGKKKGVDVVTELSTHQLALGESSRR